MASSKLAPGDPPTLVMDSTTLTIRKSPPSDGKYILDTTPVGNYDTRLTKGTPPKIAKDSELFTVPKPIPETGTFSLNTTAVGNYSSRLATGSPLVLSMESSTLNIEYQNTQSDLLNQLGKGNSQYSSKTLYLSKTDSMTDGILLGLYSKDDGKKYGSRLTNDKQDKGIYAGEVNFGKKLSIHDGSNHIIKQPFVTKKIGDRWGINDLGDADLGIIRGGLNTAIARTVADEIRLSKFILTTKGIVFGIKQLALQSFNTKAETRI